MRAERTAELRGALEQRYGGVDVFTFDGKSASPAEVLDECRSFGLMSGHKLVIVEDAEALVKSDDEGGRAVMSARKLFERYAESPCDGATLVLRSGAWRPGNLDKLVEKVGAVIECKPPTDVEAQKWVVERAAAHHKAELQADAAKMLVLRVGPDLSKLDSEVGKLAAASGGKPITAALVNEFVQPTREEAAWNIQQTLLSSGPEEALAHLRYVLDVSRHPPQLVMYAFVDLARKVHAASRALAQGGNPQTIARTLKLWGSSMDAVLGAARRVTPDRALRLLRECVQGDVRSKSGFGDVERTLERLVVRFAMLLGPQAARR